MNNFEFFNPCKIVFGKDTELEVSNYIKSFGGKKVLLHYGGGSVKANGLYDRVVGNLKEGGVAFVELGGVQPNPRLELVNEGIDLCKKEGVDFILAMGGGSVIDSSKAIGMGCHYDNIWDYYMNPSKAATIDKTIPVGVILTMPAAGSESSKATVITNGLYKRAINNDTIIPKFAIMNPEVTYSMPKNQIVNGAADMMAHLMERYFTNTQNVDLTDRLLEAALTTVIRYTPIAVENPTDYAARSEIMWAGTLAHNGLFGKGRDEDWASHAIEHELSAEYDIAHGAGLSIVMPAWMKYVYKENVAKFAQFAQRVFGISYGVGQEEAQALAGIRELEIFFKSVGLPIRMGEAQIPTDKFELMATRLFEGKGETIGQFKKLKTPDVIEIYKLAK